MGPQRAMRNEKILSSQPPRAGEPTLVPRGMLRSHRWRSGFVTAAFLAMCG